MCKGLHTCTKQAPGWKLRTYSVRRASQAAPSTIWTDLSHADSAPKRDQGLGGQLQTNHCILSQHASAPSSQNQWIRSSKPHLFNYSPGCFSYWTLRICKFVKTTQKNHYFVTPRFEPIHRKPVNPFTETASFSNRSPGCLRIRADDSNNHCTKTPKPRAGAIVYGNIFYVK